MLDPGPLAQLAADFIDGIEEKWGPEAELSDAVIVAEVRKEDAEGIPWTTVEYRSVGQRNTAEIGMLLRALDTMRTPDDDEDDAA